MKQILIIAILILFTIAAIGQNLIWDTLNTGTTKNINDIYFQSPDTGYIVGDDYLFKKTTDGGLTWIDITPPAIGEKPGNNGKIVGIDYHATSSVSNLDSGLYLAWKMGYHGFLTNDDGSSYQTFTYNDSNLFCNINGFSVLNSSVGNWFVQLITFGSDCNGNSAYYIYYDMPFSLQKNNVGQTGSYTTVDIDTFSTIFGHSDGYLLRYPGISSSSATVDSIFLDSSGVSAVASAGNNVWYASTNRPFYNMYVSTDTGKTFRLDSTLLPSFAYPNFKSLNFLSKNRGLAGAESNGGGVIVVKDTNQWDFYIAPQQINKVKLFDNGTAYAAGDSGLVMKTVITTSINEVKKANSQLTVYPNPTDDYIQLYGLGSRDVDKIQLFDLNGKLIQDFPTPGRKLSLINYQKGMYILRIHAEGKQFSRKVIVR